MSTFWIVVDLAKLAIMAAMTFHVCRLIIRGEPNRDGVGYRAPTGKDER